MSFVVQYLLLFSDSFNRFEAAMPELCEHDDESEQVCANDRIIVNSLPQQQQSLNLDVLSLRDDNISSNIDNDVDALQHERHTLSTIDSMNNDFPVQILPYLYLGNAHNATDRSTLDNYDIHYILNVTHNLPNMYEMDANRFKYLRIDAEDCCQDLSMHFADAIAFIGMSSRMRFVMSFIVCLQMKHDRRVKAYSFTVSQAYRDR